MHYGVYKGRQHYDDNDHHRPAEAENAIDGGGKLSPILSRNSYMKKQKHSMDQQDLEFEDERGVKEFVRFTNNDERKTKNSSASLTRAERKDHRSFDNVSNLISMIDRFGCIERYEKATRKLVCSLLLLTSIFPVNSF